MKKKPAISVILATLNSQRYLPEFFKNLKSQSYKNFEVLVMDGGSKDNTVKIAKNFNARIIKNPKVLAEPGIELGIKKSKGRILIIVAADNSFKEKDAIEKIFNIFKDKKISAAFPKQISSNKDTLFTKYINMFTDPFNHFVYGNASNARTFKKIYKTLFYNQIYDIYDFGSSSVRPIIAFAQGFTIRRNLVLKRENKMDDIEPVYKLIRSGRNLAYVHSVSIYHHTIESTAKFFRKQRWAARNALLGKTFGINSRKNFLSSSQKIKMYLYPIYSLTIIFPFIYSLRKCLIEKKKIWLFHPIISFISAVAIIYEYVMMKIHLSQNISRT